MGLNDDAWEELFGKYRILEKIRENGRYEISANAIKAFREPRLMTKFDHQNNLPQLFLENRLAILPISRGDYVISPFSAYEVFAEPSSEMERVHIPAYLQSLMPQFLVSESIALNCANACGILADFLEDAQIVPTVSGRMGSGRFDFKINAIGGAQDVTVRNAQIEIDAAYEGVHSLALFEAKRDISHDFLVRQLYYPYRVWSGRVSKQVRPVFLVFTNGVFYLYEYRFCNPKDYNSLRLVKQKNYIIDTGITAQDIAALVRETQPGQEPEIPFPQANSMPRILNLTERLYERPMSKDEITAAYGFDVRQTSYYTDAGRYLGLIERSGAAQFRLSEFGRRLMGLDYRLRQLEVARRILKHRVFHEALRIRLQCGIMPDTGAVVRIMKESGLYKVGADSTYFRRASTVTGWLWWILGLID